MMTLEERQALAESYRKVNESFGRSLVFRTGIDAGFFAEFKYLVHAVGYCLANRLRLRLYSRGANYSYSQGWTDYFEPFCPEAVEAYHSRFNVHSLPPLRNLVRGGGNCGAAAMARWKLKTYAYNKICRMLNLAAYGPPAQLSTSDIPPALSPHEQMEIPSIGFKGTYLEAFRMLAGMLWRFNPQTAQEIARLTASMQLPPEGYAATQIRGGDKATEVELYPPRLFAEAILRHTSLRHVLLLTDDYGILERVRRDFPQLHWHSLCTPAERGYFNKAFADREPTAKRGQMLRFLAQINAMMQAGFFAGSISVGPSLFLLEMAGPGKGLPVDCSPADLNIAAQLSIPQRDAIARKFLRAH